MKDIIAYYIVFAKYIWYKIPPVVNTIIVGRIFEGISIGIYANSVGDIIKNGATLDLLYRLIIAIILTTIGLLLQRKDN